jgi:hypothetical protein
MLFSGCIQILSLVIGSPMAEHLATAVGFENMITKVLPTKRDFELNSITRCCKLDHFIATEQFFYNHQMV